jgi:hypothetical protein
MDIWTTVHRCDVVRIITKHLNAKARGQVGSNQCEIGHELEPISTVRELSIEELKALIEEVFEENQ